MPHRSHLFDHNPFAAEIIDATISDGYSVGECRSFYRQLIGDLTHLQESPLYLLNNVLTHNISSLQKLLPKEESQGELFPETETSWDKFRKDVVNRLTATVMIVQNFPEQIPSVFPYLMYILSIVEENL